MPLIIIILIILGSCSSSRNASSTTAHTDTISLRQLNARTLSFTIDSLIRSSSLTIDSPLITITRIDSISPRIITLNARSIHFAKRTATAASFTDSATSATTLSSRSDHHQSATSSQAPLPPPSTRFIIMLLLLLILIIPNFLILKKISHQ